MDFEKILHFLIDLQFNNNRNWFSENKNQYLESKENFDSFITSFITDIKKIDSSIDVTNAKECVFRIYKDVRFSKNKEPYKNNFGAFIAKGGRKSAQAGYYLHFEPDNSFIGGGIYMPESHVLKSIRTKIVEETDRYKKIINNPEFKANFGGIFGDKLKMAPKGFDKTFPDIELIKNKHYAVSHKVSNEFWLQENLSEAIIKIFKTQLPLNQFLNEAVAQVNKDED